jgi:pimeloyl-ACP methyl ester carboxylesterase
MNSPPTVFVLIHGAQAGAWVWDSVRQHLSSPSFAVDLPGHGSHKGSLKGLRISDCVDAVLSAFPQDHRVVLVGHSMGGPIALAVATRAGPRIAQLILLAGAVPESGATQADELPPLTRFFFKMVLRFTPEFGQPRRMIRTRALNGIPASQVEKAMSRMGKESSSLFLDPVHWQLDPKLPVTYIRYLNDRGPLSPALQEQLARRLSPNVEMASIDACHYAMLEKPAELAAQLDAIAKK